MSDKGTKRKGNKLSKPEMTKKPKRSIKVFEDLPLNANPELKYKLIWNKGMVNIMIIFNFGKIC